MSARRTPTTKFEAELSGAKDKRQHQLSAACKMQVKVVLHRLSGFSKYLGPEWQGSESPDIQEEVEHPQMKQEKPERPQQQKREVQLAIKKEEVELPNVKEEEDITMSTGEPLNSEYGLSEPSRGTEPPSSSSKDGLEAHIFIAPSDRNVLDLTLNPGGRHKECQSMMMNSHPLHPL
ncbi:uncharacterized protein LOC130928952 isoform X3 [Corythoichthys intestinalis]|uniref:uncharacterized protein LOC130928952 isoform X3 n=1 Tax=Corythoichthys intestinalis TaxID=161448 RepID=UPI0025A55891|nr:uncharacterized protein LOC130928952 isoform X3 [Corythoichthys intestinalis]